jgi:hypothetical protein
MARFRNAEQALVALAGRADLPEPLAAFIAAAADNGCRRCWLSSDKSKSHWKCRAKIRRYFDAQDCNERPVWLPNAHRRLDEAVFAAYGWPANLSDDDLLAKLLPLSLERAAR